MWYLKKFSTESNYQAFKGSVDYIEPNVSLITDNNIINYNKFVIRVINFKYFDFDKQDFITCQAEENMTWEEFVNSEYNTLGLYISYNVLYAPGRYRIYNTKDFYNDIKPTDIIIENESYQHGSMQDLEI